MVFIKFAVKGLDYEFGLGLGGLFVVFVSLIVIVHYKCPMHYSLIKIFLKNIFNKFNHSNKKLYLSNQKWPNSPSKLYCRFKIFSKKFVGGE
jgi:hypothetical protein